MISQDTGIAGKKNRDQKSSEYNASKQSAGDTWIICHKPAVQKKRAEKRGEEDQLHMFPGGFVCRKNQSEYVVLTRPVINEMRDRAGDQNKNSSEDHIRF